LLKTSWADSSVDTIIRPVFAAFTGAEDHARQYHVIDMPAAAAHQPRIRRGRREAQSQRKLQVFHRVQNRRCSAAAVGAAGLGHASKKGIHRPAVGVEKSPALRGNLVQLLRTIAGADRHVAELLKVGQRWIDDARTGAVGTGDLLLYLLDDLVPGLPDDLAQRDIMEAREIGARKFGNA
jgi:hypothetical protein